MIVTASIVLIDPNANLQAIIDATPDYGTIYLAPGVYTPLTAAGFLITRPITIRGSGNEYVFTGIGPPKVARTLGTVLRPYNAGVTANGGKNSTVIQITGPVTNVVLQDFAIENPYGAPALGTGDGININATAGYIGHCRIENVSVLFMGRDGLHCDGASLGISVDQSTLSRCQFAGCTRHGIYMRYATDVDMDNLAFTGSEQCGAYFSQSNMLHLHHCLFNENGKSFVSGGATDWAGGTANWPYYDQAQLYFNGVSGFTVDGCDFEVWARHTAGNMPVPHAIGMYASGRGRVTDCSVFNSDYVHGALDSVFLTLSACFGILIGNNSISSCDYYVYALRASGNMGLTLLPSAPSTYEGSGNDAPCVVYVPNDPDTDASGTPSGGNLACIPLIGAATLDASSLSRFMAGLQLPIVGSVAAFTHDKLDGTLSIEANAKAMRLYQDGAWQTVVAGAVAIDGDVVTYDDEIVSY